MTAFHAAMTKPSQAIFLLGVGAQKAGTSWLHRELSRCDQVNFGFQKEYKAFTNLGAGNVIRQNVDRRFGKAIDCEHFEALSHANKQRWMQSDARYYCHYFRRLIDTNPALLATGDISPHYSELNAASFRRIKSLLEAGGFEVKVILLLRDPVERIWSQLRMLRRQNRFPDLCGYRSEETALAVLHRHPRFAAKTKYHHTIQALDQAFPAEHIHVDFYERLFKPEAHSRLAGFLDLDLPSADFTTRVNASPKQGEVCPMLQRTVALAYEDLYQAMIKRFGSTVLDLWPLARWIHEGRH